MESRTIRPELKRLMYATLRQKVGAKRATRQQLIYETNIPKNTLDRLFTSDCDFRDSTKAKLIAFLGITDAGLEKLLEIETNSSDHDQEAKTNQDAQSEFVDVSGAVEADASTRYVETTDSSRPASVHVKFKESKRLRQALVGSFAVAAIASVFAVGSNSMSNPCVVDFRLSLEESQRCRGIGILSVSGPYLEAWNGRVTAIDVPEGWTVRAKYEKWLAPKFEEIDQNGNGFILLKPGFNKFSGSFTYPLYRDFELTEFVKHTKPEEMNDRIQYIVITNAADGVLRIHAHKDKNNKEVLSIQPSTTKAENVAQLN